MVAISLNQTDEYNTTIEQQRNVAPCQGMPNYGFEPLDSSLPYFVNAALNVPLAVATTFANLVVLLAMRHVTSIRLPSRLLLCSLVLTDLGAGSVVQPQFVALLFSEAIYPDHEQCALLKSFLFTGSLFGLSSFFTLTSIILDRYAALFYHFNYQQIATTRRICVVIVVVWLLAIFVASTLFWSSVRTVVGPRNSSRRYQSPAHFCRVDQDSQPLANSSDPPTGSKRGSRPTGGKHTEHAEVQKSGVRYDLDPSTSSLLLHSLLGSGYRYSCFRGNGSHCVP